MGSFLFRYLVVAPAKALYRHFMGTAADARPWVAAHMFNGDVNHTWIQGGSGHGKSSLLKENIAYHIKRANEGRMSLFVMDSAELIDEIIATVRFTREQLRRVILIDLANPGGPDDPGSMPRLNILETSKGIGDEYLRVDAKVNTFKTIFEGILDNSASPNMADMLGYAAQTLAYAKSPTIDTMIELLRDPIRFINGMPNLPVKVKEYWQDEIKMKPVKENGEVVDFEPDFSETQRGVLRRIRGLESSQIIKRLLLNAEPTVDLAKKLNEGSIILVATRKGALHEEGTRTVMRFMLSMLHRAAESRHSLGGKMETAIYIDEFQDALKGKDDESIKLILSQIRKRGCAMVLANQERGQLSVDMRSSLKANCANRIAGGISPDDEEDTRKLLAIRKIQTDEGQQWSVDLGTLKKGQFCAYQKGKKPSVITTKRDALGEEFTRLPANDDKRIMVIERELARVRDYMRKAYAEKKTVRKTREEQAMRAPRPAYIQ